MDHSHHIGSILSLLLLPPSILLRCRVRASLTAIYGYNPHETEERDHETTLHFDLQDRPRPRLPMVGVQVEVGLAHLKIFMRGGAPS